MRVLISGSSGLLGTSLILSFENKGYDIVRLVRKKTEQPGDIFWQPNEGVIEIEKMEDIDAIVHLAGESIAGIWTESKKKSIRNSRIEGTRFLSQTLVRLAKPPKVFISASASGFYGDTGYEWVDEQSNNGEGFLAQLCQDWETEAIPVKQKGVRVVLARFGVILSPKGGALEKMLKPFKAGLGGPLGGGRQYMSWIAIDDAVEAIQHILNNDQLQGPVNVVSPQPVTNKEFTKSLSKVLKRPALFPIPYKVLHSMFGEMADEMLLVSQRIKPAKLLEAGYNFRFPELQNCLKYMLEK